MKLIQMFTRLTLLCGALFSLQGLAADNIRYVNDHLIITLRAGQGSEYKILKSLPTGTRLELLDEGEGTDFSKVRTEDGIEGWVNSWYLNETPPAKILLTAATDKVKRLETENQKLSASNVESKQTIQDLEKRLGKREDEVTQLQAENNRLKDIAGRPIELESANKRLTAELARLQQENQNFSSENSGLRQSSVQKWFMTGSGVLIAGIVVGLILPRLQRRKGSDWS